MRPDLSVVSGYHDLCMEVRAAKRTGRPARIRMSPDFLGSLDAMFEPYTLEGGVLYGVRIYRDSSLQERWEIDMEVG